MVANLISRLVRNFKPAYVNESRSGELLAAGCAAGVACTFIAPIGGELFFFQNVFFFCLSFFTKIEKNIADKVIPQMKFCFYVLYLNFSNQIGRIKR